MIYIRRPKLLRRTSILKCVAGPILVAVVFVPVQAGKTKTQREGASAAAYASAKIRKGFDMRPEIFPKSGKRVDQNISDISSRACDIEVRKIIKKCVLMIYEIQ